MRTKEPLSVELAPGILEEIFDGIQRPLNKIAEQSKSVFVPIGVNVPSLNESKLWEFTPSKTIKVGSRVVGGDILGHVYENELLDTHHILVPPKIKGTVTFIAPAGNYE
jgi:V-type H+-transporting ATPase subunit A